MVKSLRTVEARVRKKLSRIPRHLVSGLQVALRWLRGAGLRVLIVLPEYASGAQRAVLERRWRFYVHSITARGRRMTVVRRARCSLMSACVADVVLFGADGPEWARWRPRLRHGFLVDPTSNPHDAWEIAAASERLLRRSVPHDERYQRERLARAVKTARARCGERVYLFGTGPSLRNAGLRRFDDGTVVVCNTIVRDADLWKHLNPSFIVAGDAIYHFGDNRHSEAFRADLIARLQSAGERCLFVYPRMFQSVVESELSSVRDLTVPIPVGTHVNPCVNLLERFELPGLGNVLNLLLLPLGCTLGHDVKLWGFDGRAPSDKGFWANSGLHSYPEFMEELRREHPAFFAANVPKGDEERYVRTVHGDALEQALSVAEDQGFRFEMMHASWTPTLQRRFLGESSD